MRVCWIIVLAGVCYRTQAFAVADVISNYAKVAVNDGSLHEGNATTTLPTTTTTTEPPIGNKTTTVDDDEDDAPNYDDFDDIGETTERSQSSGVDTDTMLTYFNGFVNLLALMYKFGGNSNSIRPGSLHFSKSRPRNSDVDPLASSINNMAEDRFHPTTATKKFKIQQGYPSVDTFPPYNPYAAPAAETYSSNGGKTSYDSDATQYMIKNPVDSSMGDSLPVKIVDAVSVPKNPMKDYMTQNEPVDIQQSYSYEVPQPAKKMKMKPSGPWEKPPEEPEPDHGSLYYPWKTKAPPPPEEVDEDEKPVGPVYYPWMSPPKKMKLKPPPPPPEDEEDSPPPQGWDMGPPMKSKGKPPKDTPPADDSALYYPWMSYGPPKKSKPAPQEDEDAPEDDSSWGMKPPSKSKPGGEMGPPPDDHVYPYPYYGDHDHGVVYHDDHKEEEPEEDHQMKDEDRESKRPYTYYHLGRKLWYVPLLFSLYFIVYIASLILKSIARHKVQLPEKLWELNDHHHHHDDHDRRSRKIEDITRKVYHGLDKAQNKFM